ncbi:hypothetical protein TPA0907_22520 [Micromonospora humidisoli]|nr:hypothetical protein TPA0907_22520 [Micromonospora sp. AKA109]
MTPNLPPQHDPGALVGATVSRALTGPAGAGVSVIPGRDLPLVRSGALDTPGRQPLYRALLAGRVGRAFVGAVRRCVWCVTTAKAS